MPKKPISKEFIIVWVLALGLAFEFGLWIGKRSRELDIMVYDKALRKSAGADAQRYFDNAKEEALDGK